MKIEVPLVNQQLADKYGKYAQEADRYNQKPITSFPFTVSDIPDGTRYLAWTLIDHDSIPVVGFSFIHWTVANFVVNHSIINIPENFSQDNRTVIQGKNSLTSRFIGETDPKNAEHYTGPTPPNQDHDYSLTVYGLSDKLDLQNGFYLNQMYQQLEINGKVLAETTIKINSRA